ncbi:MAG TPA: hypothetical protein VEZ46_14345 [Mycobacteriales bacterium]|jgi:hypothetical protein|nr:hypothetical protein [Mycobacteriales bacterium]
MTTQSSGSYTARSRAQSAADRRRRRQQLLEQRQLTTTWRNRLLARRLKYIKAHQDLARHLSSLDSGLPPTRSHGG